MLLILLQPPSTPVQGGLIKVRLDGNWAEKPIKVRINSNWVQKPLKKYKSGQWV